MTEHFGVDVYREDTSHRNIKHNLRKCRHISSQTSHVNNRDIILIVISLWPCAPVIADNLSQFNVTHFNN